MKNVRSLKSAGNTLSVEVPAPWVGYIRVSTKEQAETGLGMEAQRDRIRNYIAGTKGVQLQEIFEDAAESAKNIRRPALDRLRQLVASRAISGVVIFKLDRLTRSVRHLGELIDEFTSHDVALASVTETLDTSTATGRMMINIIGTIAQWEREIICERTKAALEVKLRRGEHAGNVAYGFMSTGKKGKAVENPQEQAIIKKMLDLRNSRTWGSCGHLPLREVAKRLNEMGFKTRRGGEWKVQYVANVLKQVGKRK